MRPIIGIGAYPRTLETVFGPTLLHTASRFYIRAVERAGGVPVILPVTEPSAVVDVMGILDGVVLTGGGDIAPHLYGSTPGDATRSVDPQRDAFEVKLFQETVAAGLPLLAVCRGMQLMNVAMGGTLLQDVFAATGFFHDDHTRWREGVHRVKIEPNSHLAEALGVVELSVNSVHHQGIDRVGRDLRVVARAPDDSVEALELATAAFALGVQWHPEVLEEQPEQQGLFRELVSRARARAARG